MKPKRSFLLLLFLYLVLEEFLSLSFGLLLDLFLEIFFSEPLLFFFIYLFVFFSGAQVARSNWFGFLSLSKER